MTKVSLKDIFIENGSYKLVALFITLILWVSVLGRKETTVTREVPIQYITSEKKIVSKSSVKTVRYELTGSRRALRRFISDKIEPISFDLNTRDQGRIIVSVPEEALRLPFGVKVLSVNPPSVVLEIEDVIKKSVPVVVTWRDPKEVTPQVERAIIEPSELVIEGARSVVGRMRELVTAEVSTRDAARDGNEYVIRTRIRIPEVEGLKSNLDQEVVIRFK